MRSPRTARGRRRAVPAAVVPALLAMALLVLAVVVLTVVRGARDDGGAGPATPTATPTAAQQAAASPTPSPEPTDGAAAPVSSRPLGEVLVTAAGRFVSGDLGPRHGPPTGALGEHGGSFSNGRDTVVLRAWEWPSPEAADGPLGSPPAGFDGADLLETGQVGEPTVGAYRYYERDGRAALRWTNGHLLLELTGRPEPVRALYLAYPV